MKTRLIFIRHGFSESNKCGVFTGQADIPLTEIGLRQADYAASYLKDMHIDKLYASPLSRAYDTGLAIAKEHGLRMIADARLCEINGGDWQEQPYSRMGEICFENYDLWKNNLIECKCPNGETVREFAKRVYTAVTEIAEANAGKTICIVTHATPIRVISCYASGLEIEQLQNVPWTPNASINIIDYENGKFAFIERDITRHLKNLETNLPSHV